EIGRPDAGVARLRTALESPNRLRLLGSTPGTLALALLAELVSDSNRPIDRPPKVMAANRAGAYPLPALWGRVRPPPPSTRELIRLAHEFGGEAAAGARFLAAEEPALAAALLAQPITHSSREDKGISDMGESMTDFAGLFLLLPGLVELNLPGLVAGV